MVIFEIPCDLLGSVKSQFRELRCSQGPKQIPASWCRFMSELLSTTGMPWGAGNQEPMKPEEEATLKKFIGDHTGDYKSTVPHSFLICYDDDFFVTSREGLPCALCHGRDKRLDGGRSGEDRCNTFHVLVFYRFGTLN